MIRYRHVIAVGMLALCACAVGPAVAQTPAVETQSARVSESEEAAALSDRVSRVEGRVEGMEEASTQAAVAAQHAARASEEASRSAQGVIEEVGTCTKLVTLVIAIIGVLLGFYGYRELKGVQAVRKEAEDLLKETTQKADEAVKAAAACAASAKESLANILVSEERVRERVEGIETLAREAAVHRDTAKARAEETDDLFEKVRAAAEMHLTKDVSDAQRQTLEDAKRAADRLEEMGEELKPEADLMGGAFAYLRGDHERALAEFDRAIALNPDSAGAHNNRGLALVKLNRHKEALKAFNRTVELNPTHAVGWCNKAAVLIDLQRYDEALPAAEQAIQLDPSLADAHTNKASALFWLRRPKESLAAAKRAIDVNAEHAGAHSTKGAALIALGDYDGALIACDHAIRLRPDFDEAYYNRACAHARLQHRDKAVRDLKKAIDLDVKFREMARTEDDFASLRDDPEFRKLVGPDEEGGEGA